MSIFFQVLRGIFYFFTLLMGVLLLRGDIIFGPEVFAVIKEVMMPGYLVFCGVMIGYLIAVVWQGKVPGSGELHIKENIFKKSFIIGVVVGILLALTYVLI